MTSIRTSEFYDELTTGSAGRRQGRGGDNDRIEFSMAARDGGADGVSFGADRQPVGGIFDIAAGDDRLAVA